MSRSGSPSCPGNAAGPAAPADGKNTPPRAADTQAAKSSADLELKITSDPANLRPVRLQIEQFARDAGFSGEAADGMGLALNEALANIIRHGYDGRPDQPVVVMAKFQGGEIRLTIRDWSRPFDPSLLPPPLENRATEQKLMPGGLGLLCMHKMMDEVKYTPLADGMELTMMKKLTG